MLGNICLGCFGKLAKREKKEYPKIHINNTLVGASFYETCAWFVSEGAINILIKEIMIHMVGMPLDR